MSGHKRGWIVALVVLFALTGAGIVGLGIVLSGKKVGVKPASTLVFDFTDELLEDPPAGARSRLFYRDSPTLWDHLHALDLAAKDEHVEAVLLRIDGIDMGWAKAEELRDKLIDLEEKGKKVIAYVTSGEDQDYYLASAADEIYMAPNTDLFLDGLTSEGLYFKGALDKVGVRADMEHIGEYKDAMEPFTRSGPSDPSREASHDLLAETYTRLVDAIATSRGVDSLAATKIIDQGPFTSKQALAAGLVDSLVYPDELEELLPGGEGGDRVSIEDYLAAQPPDLNAGEPKIAVVHATGTIVSGKSGTDAIWGRTIGSDSFQDALDEATGEDDVHAIVVRIDSPGGDVYASHLMWHALKKASEEVPVVASFSDLAASGGYYMAMGADTVLADESTITGSIGVVGGKFNIRGLLDKIGVGVDTDALGANAQWMSSTRDFTPAERERYLADMFNEYRTFVDIVAENRGLTAEDVDPIARGRVWTGGQAYERGLVDELGGLEKSITVAKVMAGIKPDAPVRVESFPRVKKTLLQEFISKLVAEEDLDALGGAHAGRGVFDARTLLRPAADLSASLARLAKRPTLAILPYRIRIR